MAGIVRKGVKRSTSERDDRNSGQDIFSKEPTNKVEQLEAKRWRAYSDFYSSDTGYTSGSDLQGETTTDSREDSRESRGGVLLVEKSDERVTACIPGAAEFPEPLPNTDILNCHFSASDDGGEEDTDLCRNLVENGVEEAHLDRVNEQTLDDGVNADENEDSVSEISGLSDVSITGAGRWHPMKGPMAWVYRQMSRGSDPRAVLRALVPQDTDIPDELDNLTLWKIILSLLSEPPRRKRLTDITRLEHVLRLLRESQKILVLTGAGVSVSCGIPDFRSANGIYARLSVDYPDLPNPQAMFDIRYFRQNPKPFFQFAKEIYPGQFAPSTSHRFIHHLERDGRLLRNYTQNIDTLEQAAGITQVVQCHGSFATATCMACRHRVDADCIREDIMNQVIPRCTQCDQSNEEAVVKPDIVFFGQSLPEEFHRQMQLDKDECDLLIVIGSSLKVQPVALIPNSLPSHVPQVLINREPLRHLNFDVELLGDCDVIVNELCHRLGGHFSELCSTASPATETTAEDVELPNLSDGNISEMPTDSASTPAVAKSIVEIVEATDLTSVPCSSGSTGTSGLPAATTTSATDNVVKSLSRSVEAQIDTVIGAQTAATADDTGVGCSTSTRHNTEEFPKMAPVNWASLLKQDTFMYVPPRRYVFSGAEVYGRLTEEDDDDNDDADDDSSVVSADNHDVLTDNECSDTVRQIVNSDTNYPGSTAYPQTPPELADLDSSNGSLDP